MTSRQKLPARQVHADVRFLIQNLLQPFSPTGWDAPLSHLGHREGSAHMSAFLYRHEEQTQHKRRRQEPGYWYTHVQASIWCEGRVRCILKIAEGNELSVPPDACSCPSEAKIKPHSLLCFGLKHGYLYCLWGSLKLRYEYWQSQSRRRDRSKEVRAGFIDLYKTAGTKIAPDQKNYFAHAERPEYSAQTSCAWVEAVFNIATRSHVNVQIKRNVKAVREPCTPANLNAGSAMQLTVNTETLKIGPH